MKLSWRAGSVLLATLVAGVTACRQGTETLRYGFVVTCDGRLDQLDTVANRKVASHDLAKTPGAVNPIPAPGGGMDGCLVYHARFDAASSVLYLVAASQARMKPDGTRDYRVLGLSIPEVRVVRDELAGSNLSDPPRFDIGPNGGLKMTQAADSAAPADLDLSTFAPDRAALGNQIIERSGNRVLLRIFNQNPAELTLAVADTQAKTIVRLPLRPPTTALNAHLAPGGAAVLIEAVDSGGPAKTGELALFDAGNGHELEEISAPNVRDQYFLAISPNGRAIYHSGVDYSFVDLKRPFSDTPVVRVSDSNSAAVFFAK